MPILSVWLINKSGGLIYQKDFIESGSASSGASGSAGVSVPKLSTNDFLVLAGTFQSVHAIATQLNPIGTKCSGIEGLEWHGFSKPVVVRESETSTLDSQDLTSSSLPFKLNCFQSPTGLKILLLTSPRQPQLDYILKRIYELYADYAMKNPFQTPEMPVRSEKFEGAVGRLVKQMSTNNYL